MDPLPDLASDAYARPNMTCASSSPSPVSATAELSGTATLRRRHLALSWLIKLRWGAFAGQFIVIAASSALCGVAVPLGPSGAIIACAALTNLALHRHAKKGGKSDECLLVLVLAFDMLCLTALLFFSGGPTNPFYFFYVVFLALAATMLSGQSLAALQVLTLACLAMLFCWHQPLPIDVAVMPPKLARQAMAVALGMAGLFVCTFVRRLTTALHEAEDQLALARERAARDEQLSSLATLAAGAAHELSTPLSTISIAAGEMNRSFDVGPNLTQIREDTALIRREVERARGILQQMVDDAGTSIAEPAQAIAAVDLLAAALAGLSGYNRVRVVVMPGSESTLVRVPRRSLARSVRALVNNALEATRQREAGLGLAEALRATIPVEVFVESHGRQCHIVVRDEGLGMQAHVRDRATEPFYSTKGPGQGMGLGLFLARSVLERLGGGLDVDSLPGAGTTVTLSMPVVELSVVPQRGSHSMVSHGREKGYPYGSERDTAAHASFG